MSDDVKLCPHCGKKLRSDNTRGACSDCLARGKGSATAVDQTGEPKKKNGPKKASETMRNFRTVAAALGKDPDAILEEAAHAWLELVRKAVED